MTTMPVWKLVLGIVASFGVGCYVGLLVGVLLAAAKRGDDVDKT